MRLAGKVAIVTGAGSGIGRAGAVALAREGAKVMVSDINPEGGAATVGLIRDASGEARFVAADVSQAPACERLVRDTVTAYGAVHILYNNAGIALPFEDGFAPRVDPAVWDHVIATNLSSVFYCSHFAIPEMIKAGGGVIINTASSMAHLPVGGLDGYAASKGGVAVLTKSMAVGCGRFNIRVNAISPGYVDTPINAVIWQSEEMKSAFAKGHATGLQTADEIAEVVVFLASDAARSLTGAVINCDRGWTAFKQPDLGR